MVVHIGNQEGLTARHCEARRNLTSYSVLKPYTVIYIIIKRSTSCKAPGVCIKTTVACQGSGYFVGSHCSRCTIPC